MRKAHNPPRTARALEVKPLSAIAASPKSKCTLHAFVGKPALVVEVQYREGEPVPVQLHVRTVQPATHPVLNATDVEGSEFS
jgi:hypothetical protein